MKSLEQENILNRDFKANGPYQKLGTDITVFITNKGKVYLSPIIDFHENLLFFWLSTLAYSNDLIYILFENLNFLA